MRAGACNKWVTLSRSPMAESEDRFTDLSPAGVFAAIEPLPPGGTDDRTIDTLVRMRFHPEVTCDTRILYEDNRIGRTRSLFVRGIQAVNEAGDEMNLLCQEVQP